MNIRPAKRMEGFEEGIFQVLNEKKKEVEQTGRKVYNFSVGTPDFKPAQHIIDAVMEAASKPENYKYALADIPELIKAVISRFQKFVYSTIRSFIINSMEAHANFRI